MTDDQFDEICRGALAYDPGAASASTWSKVRPAKRSWLPTVPEILACGCACGLLLVGIGFRVGTSRGADATANPVIERAVGGSLNGLQASTVQIPDTSSWTTGYSPLDASEIWKYKAR